MQVAVWEEDSDTGDLEWRTLMKIYLSKIMLFNLSLVLVIYFLMPTFQVLAQDNQPSQPEQTAVPSSLAEVDSYLAGMSDAQVRQAYA